MKTVLVDFEDSFTLNIYSELRSLGLEVEVLAWQKAGEFFETRLNSNEKLIVVLGPGPGHPLERKELFGSLKKILAEPSVFVLGICLGHQLLAAVLGLKVGRSSRPAHGEVETIPLDKNQAKAFGFEGGELTVQRYNSLAVAVEENARTLRKSGVEFLDFEGEVQIMRGKGFLSYQFHPESVGTSCRQSFFRPLLSFA